VPEVAVIAETATVYAGPSADINREVSHF